MFRYLLFVLLAALPLSASAATLTRTGAIDVNLNGTLYDVEFVAGSCGDVFDGCDEASDFIFDKSLASTAAYVLLGLINQSPNIDADLRITGCAELYSTDVCIIYIPYASIRDIGLSEPVLDHTYVENWELIDDDVDGYGRGLCCLTTSHDTSRNEYETFARWTLSSERGPQPGVIPLPGSGILLGSALLGAVASRRRKARR